MSLKEQIDEAFSMGIDELEDQLPSLLEELDRNVIELLEDDPELLPRLFNKMDEIDAGELARNAPAVVDQFQDFLWDATRELIKHDGEMRSNINVNVTVNFEATDSDMSGQLVVDGDEQLVKGDSEPAGNADLTISAKTDVLIDLLVGNIDPVQGFITNQYSMEGPPSEGIKLVPVLNTISDRYTELE